MLSGTGFKTTLCLALVVLCPRLSWAKYGGGSGTPYDPYQLETFAHLVTLMERPEDWNRCFQLMADIQWDNTIDDLGATIGNEDRAFSGRFDGQYHVISGFSFLNPSGQYVGLFGHVAAGGVIQNLGLDQVSIEGHWRVGALIGENEGSVYYCWTSGDVEGVGNVGGLAGTNAGTVYHSYSHAHVTADFGVVGGLIGRLYSSGHVIHCYSTGRVSSIDDDTQDLGGLIGDRYRGEVLNCFWDQQSSLRDTSQGGTGITTEQMQTMDTFQERDWTFCHHDEFGLWVMPESSAYPVLWWQDDRCPLPSIFSQGSGTPDDPYLLSSAEQIMKLGGRPQWLDRCFRLTRDIDLQDVNVPMIGNAYGPFVGVFDGNGFTLINVVLPYPEQQVVGLFRVLGADGVIQNLGLVDLHAQGGADCGALVGFNLGEISRCYATGSLQGGYQSGGLVALNDGWISESFTVVDVNAAAVAGGLVGSNKGQIQACYALGAVHASNSAGGLVGENIGTTARSRGRSLTNDGAGNGTIVACYAIGPVSADYHGVGGLCPVNSGLVLNSFWDTETSGQMTSAAGKGLPTESLQQSDTFIHWNTPTALRWTLDAGRDYPHLSWEARPGDLIPVYQIEDFLSGSGSAENPYLISRAEQLNVVGRFPEAWNRCFELVVDIDLIDTLGEDFNRIGLSEDLPFSGTFNGNGFYVRHLTHQYVPCTNVGLFGFISEEGMVKNLNLNQALIHLGHSIGALAGVNEGTLRNCQVTCDIKGGSAAGGLVGHNSGRIVDCSVFGDVHVSFEAGGLVGRNHGSIVLSHALGRVSGNHVGGLVGHNREGQVYNSYARASVSGRPACGGLIGFGDDDLLVNCYSAASVSDSTSAGGLVGYSRDTITKGCFWDTDASGLEVSAVGLGRTTLQMQDITLYEAAGWDIAMASSAARTLWLLPDEGDYPVLNAGRITGTNLPVFSGGDGSQASPYLLSTPEDLIELAGSPTTLDKHFRLINNIDLTGIEMDMIGAQGNPFNGVFDGDGYQISGFAFDRPVEIAGFFSCIGQGAVVRNLGLAHLDISADNYVGGLAGINLGTIQCCYTTGYVSAFNEMGGVTGRDMGSTVNCISFVEIHARELE